MNEDTSIGVSDEEVVRQVLDGHVEDFRILVERYQRKIFMLGRSFLRNSDDAMDFVQEVFLKAYTSLSTFRGVSGGARFYSWLVKIAYNHGINSVRRAKVWLSLSEVYEPDSCIALEDDHLKTEVKAALSKALQELPERYAVCLDLYFFYGLSYGEIEDVTGFPVNTIKSHVFRAKGLLKKALSGTVAEDVYGEA